MEIQEEYKKLQRSETSRRNAKRGNKTEEIAGRYLKSLGFLFVEPIERAWIIIRKYDPKRKKSRITGAVPKKKVSGDFTAIEPGTGRYVHIEVKSMHDKIMWSNLEPHQIEALNDKHKAGALCLLVWVRSPIEIKAMEWPVFGFGPRKSVKWDDIK